MHVSRDCVTSVSSYVYSDPPIQLGERAVSSSRVLLAFTLRGLPELAARGFLVYFENIECRPNAVGVGAKAQYHLRGGAAGARLVSYPTLSAGRHFIRRLPGSGKDCTQNRCTVLT